MSDHALTTRAGLGVLAVGASLPMLWSCSDLLGIRILDREVNRDARFNTPSQSAPPQQTGGPEPGAADAGKPDAAAPPEAMPSPFRTFFGHYRFARGPSSHFVDAGTGLLAGTAAAVVRLMTVTIATERGGRVELLEDGSFRYFPASPSFWGDDAFESATDLFRIRARLTVQPIGDLELSDFGDGLGNGFVVQGGADFGRSIAGSGDVDGDGRQDVLIGRAALVGSEATGCAVPCHASAGAAYSIFGRAATAPILAENLARGLERGFLVDGLASSRLDSLGYAVSGGGDTDGDGFDDLLMGAPFVGHEVFAGGYGGYGGSFLVFGGTSGPRVATAEIFSGACPADAPMPGIFSELQTL